LLAVFIRQCFVRAIHIGHSCTRQKIKKTEILIPDIVKTAGQQTDRRFRHNVLLAGINVVQLYL